MNNDNIETKILYNDIDYLKDGYSIKGIEYSYEYVNGETFTMRGKTFYFGGSDGGVGIYSNGTNDGLDESNIADLDYLKIPFESDEVTPETDNDKINEINELN